MDGILRTILLEWTERKLPEVLPRQKKLRIKKIPHVRKATVITGFRRVGKTYLLFELIKHLLGRFSRMEVIYINFEDERISPNTQILTRLLPTIKSLFGKKPKYLFLDELQNIPNWSKWARRVLDTEETLLYITGSSSKMSSRELPTELRGRAWEEKVFPLTFAEFLSFKREEIDSKKLKHLAYERAKFDFLFDEYLVYGGLPEVVLVPEAKRTELLQSYFQTVVRKEIVERFNVGNELALQTALKLLLNSTYFTVSKLYNSLKSLGVKIGKTTLNEYLAHIESSYFLGQLYYFSPSMKNRLQYPRKAYFVDNGFLTALSVKFSKDQGRLFENLAYQFLSKNNKNLFYYKDEKEKEIDFVIREGEKTKKLIQVCHDLSDLETREREIKNLVAAGKRLKCNKLSLIARRGMENLKLPSNIKLIPHYELFT